MQAPFRLRTGLSQPAARSGREPRPATRASCRVLVQACPRTQRVRPLESATAPALTLDRIVSTDSCQTCALRDWRWDRFIRWASTARAASRPSEMAQTTSDWPRRQSPAANTPGSRVAKARGSAATFPRSSSATPSSPNSGAGRGPVKPIASKTRSAGISRANRAPARSSATPGSRSRTKRSCA